MNFFQRAGRIFIIFDIKNAVRYAALRFCLYPVGIIFSLWWRLNVLCRYLFCLLFSWYLLLFYLHYHVGSSYRQEYPSPSKCR